MKLPEFILDYAKRDCNIKASDKEIFRFVKMLFENEFDQYEILLLLEYIRQLEA